MGVLSSIIRYATTNKYWILVHIHSGQLVVRTSVFKPWSNRYVTFVDGPFYTHERLESSFQFWCKNTPPRRYDDPEENIYNHEDS